MTRKFDGTELVVATHNQGKLAEFADLFGAREFKLYTATDFGLPSPPETGTTFIENAKMKALFAAQGSGKPALADDSGLCIDALNGDPGVYSADWAEKPDGSRDFGYAIDVILEKMGDTSKRTAHFVSVIILAWPDGHYEIVEGIAPGVITAGKQGVGGHGYDPIFKPDGYAVTYAEMPAAEKNKISHRAIAFQKIMDLCF